MKAHARIKHPDDPSASLRRSRPAHPLLAPLSSLPGLGAASERRLARLLGREAPRVADLLFHLPRAAEEIIRPERLTPDLEGRLVWLEVRIREHRPGTAPRPHRILTESLGEPLELVFFHGQPSWLARRFPVGERRRIRGRLQRYRGMWQIAHPETARSGEPAERALVYPLSGELRQQPLRRLVAAAFARVGEVPEWHRPELLRRLGLPSFRNALMRLHQGLEPPDGEDGPGRLRLALDELFALQLALQLARKSRSDRPGRVLRGTGRLVRALLARLPFAPTAAQIHAFEEIRADLAAPRPMMRLLQGDVGSGKTLVALLAMLTAAEEGLQAALMAPTEVLARQHHRTLSRYLAPLGLEVGLLVGGETAGRRARLLAGLESGRLLLCVGTHALLQPEVRFADLALAVVDEQHRFGVAQRLGLVGKGEAVDVLLMTATPIPRSLLLCWYGDMACSRLLEKPPGRKPVDTRAVPIGRICEVIDAVGRALHSGAQGYWICPAVDAGEMGAAEARFSELRGRFGDRVGLLHGGMGKREKEATMAAFARGTLRLLVATTVVEVGVDVPAARFIVVEQAERFGLAQLHQLRGRVGRGAGDGSCLLLYKPPLSSAARARLALLRETDDGFRIAEEDLRLRGPGEVLGVRQSGVPEFRFARLPQHEPLLRVAADQARRLVERAEPPEGEERRALLLLLALFDHDAAGELLRAG